MRTTEILASYNNQVEKAAVRKKRDIANSLYHYYQKHRLWGRSLDVFLYFVLAARLDYALFAYPDYRVAATPLSLASFIAAILLVIFWLFMLSVVFAENSTYERSIFEKYPVCGPFSALHFSYRYYANLKTEGLPTTITDAELLNPDQLFEACQAYLQDGRAVRDALLTSIRARRSELMDAQRRLATMSHNLGDDAVEQKKAVDILATKIPEQIDQLLVQEKEASNSLNELEAYVDNVGNTVRNVKAIKDIKSIVGIVNDVDVELLRNEEVLERLGELSTNALTQLKAISETEALTAREVLALGA